jgi:acyl-CoA dehydrogenase family protein 9
VTATAVVPQSPRQHHFVTPEVKPSFTRSIFLGELREDLVFPFPTLSPDESESLRAILDSFRAFAAEYIDSRTFDREGEFPPELRRAFHDWGFMGLAIPVEYGGLGASAKVYSRVFAEIGGVDPALCVYAGAHQSIGCKGIVLFGTEDQKQRYLPRCASGELVAAFCLTEPGSGSDAQAMKSTAVLSDDGTHYVLTGNKIWISNAGYADLFTVFAKVVEIVAGVRKERVTAFIVDAHASGVTLGKREDKMGIKASDTRAVFLDHVRVPVEDRLGDVGQGFRIALEILNSGRLGLAAASARGARQIMREALSYAKQREQFGRSIGMFEMLQRKIAENAAECYAIDSAVMIAADMVDRGGVDYSLETAVCKVFASELAFRAANDALQIAGGIGYSREYPYEQAVRDSRINLIFEGTNEILRALIALSGLQQPAEHLQAIGRAFKDPLHSLGALGHYFVGRAKRTVSWPHLSMVDPTLAKEARLVAKLVHRLGLVVERTIVAQGKALIDRQFIQERLANAAIDIALASMVMSRTTWEIQRAGSDAAAHCQVECARAFISIANRRVLRNLRGVERNQDARLSVIAKCALSDGDLGPPPPSDR